ncbi:head-tail joining protein [Nitrospirillum sp. BR 11163]|uniref:head-tail joining protein n=1 Tax=Nitrospirillum sp. BR 11163 TaxID=3104323 RepID=UPI002AFE2BA9|nr:hypothetical protein [Nitrospirillum sp. BR 11163]MEA1674096.1 hypothetical protein [Nitrospirillum sp. BR 11163]
MIDWDAALLAPVAETFGVDNAFVIGANGVRVPCRPIPHTPDRELTIGSARVIAGGKTYEIRVAEVPVIAEGDQLEVSGVAYRVTKASRPDDDPLMWVVAVK